MGLDYPAWVANIHGRIVEPFVCNECKDAYDYNFDGCCPNCHAPRNQCETCGEMFSGDLTDDEGAFRCPDHGGVKR